MPVEHEPEALRVQLRDRRARHEPADEVEEDVDPAEALADRGSGGRGSAFRPQVADRGDPPVIGQAGRAGHLDETARVGPAQPDATAIRGKRARDDAPERTGGTRDQDDAIARHVQRVGLTGGSRPHDRDPLGHHPSRCDPA
jgi:hypothetical protein